MSKCGYCGVDLMHGDHFTWCANATMSRGTKEETMTSVKEQNKELADKGRPVKPHRPSQTVVDHWPHPLPNGEPAFDKPTTPRQEGTPLTDALIEEMLHGDGIPRCDEWERLERHARQLERRLAAREPATEAVLEELLDLRPVLIKAYARGSEARRIISQLLNHAEAALRASPSPEPGMVELEKAVVEAAKGWLARYEDEVRDPSEEAPCKALVAALDALAAVQQKADKPSGQSGEG